MSMDEDERAQRYELKADRYDQMADCIEQGDGQGIAYLPKYVPRGRPPKWYREQASKFRRQAELADDISSFYREEARKKFLAKLPPELRAMVEEEREAMNEAIIVEAFQELSTEAKKAILAELKRLLEQGAEGEASE